MTNAELLTKVKAALGNLPDYHNETLQTYIDEAKAFLKSAGVKDSVLCSAAAVGCIVRGVADLWNYGSGSVTFSDYFRMRAIQLAAEPGENDVTVPNMTEVIFVPLEEDLEELGWAISAIGVSKTIQAQEFTVTDSERITATVTCPDGTIMTGEDATTGTRRRISLSSSEYIILMPQTEYDKAQSKFVTAENRTTIFFSAPSCYGAKIVLETYTKEA